MPQNNPLGYDCALCLFACENKEAGKYCVRHPPRPFPSQVEHPITGAVTMISISIQPPVKDGQWCGEFEAKQQKKMFTRRINRTPPPVEGG